MSRNATENSRLEFRGSAISGAERDARAIGKIDWSKFQGWSRLAFKSLTSCSPDACNSHVLATAHRVRKSLCETRTRPWFVPLPESYHRSCPCYLLRLNFKLPPSPSWEKEEKIILYVQLCCALFFEKSQLWGNTLPRDVFLFFFFFFDSRRNFCWKLKSRLISNFW